MFQFVIHRPIKVVRRRPGAGLSLAEAVLAMAILSVVLTAILNATLAGHQHMRSSSGTLEASRLAEQLLEECRARPYQGSGFTRSEFHLPDYAGMEEVPGDLRDASGALLPPQFQRLRRKVTLSDATIQLNGLESISIPARKVHVRVTDDAGGIQADLTSLVVEPYSP